MKEYDQKQTVYETQFGAGLLVWRDGLLIAHRLPDRHRSGTNRLQPSTAAERQMTDLLEAYFRGEPVAFPLEGLPLESSPWSPFDRDVAAALSAVPFGQTVSYSGLAVAAGHPRAQRAVGSFMARNPFPVILACHRVICSSGRLGDFSSGIDWKLRLLALEGIHL